LGKGEAAKNFLRKLAHVTPKQRSLSDPCITPEKYLLNVTFADENPCAQGGAHETGAQTRTQGGAHETGAQTRAQGGAHENAAHAHAQEGTRGEKGRRTTNASKHSRKGTKGEKETTRSVGSEPEFGEKAEKKRKGRPVTKETSADGLLDEPWNREIFEPPNSGKASKAKGKKGPRKLSLFERSPVWKIWKDHKT